MEEKSGNHNENRNYAGMSERANCEEVEYKKYNSSTVIDYYGQKYIEVCRKIRSAAIRGKLKIDKTPHNESDNNLHWVKLMEACGLTADSFANNYLSVLQPYSLEPFMEYNEADDRKWMVDIGYGVKLVVEEQNLSGQADENVFIVSFHESNIQEINQYKQESSFDKEKYCAVICDEIGEKECDMFSFHATVQQGFLRHLVRGFADYVHNDVVLVKYFKIKNRFSASMEALLTKLNESYYSDPQKESITYINDLHEFSFLAFGHADINNILFLIELFRQTTIPAERQVIAEISKSILEEISDTRREEIIAGLKARYELSNKQISENPLLYALVSEF